MKGKRILIISIFFYSIILLYQFSQQIYLYELFIPIIFYITLLKKKVSVRDAYLYAFIPFLHVVGTINFTIDLYQWPPYDFITHFVGFFLAAVLIYPKVKQKFLVIFILLGLGSLMELTEYIGFLIFGHGKGAFYFGSGDIDSFGAWGDSMNDLLANLLGAAAGFVSKIKFFKK